MQHHYRSYREQDNTESECRGSQVEDKQYYGVDPHRPADTCPGGHRNGGYGEDHRHGRSRVLYVAGPPRVECNRCTGQHNQGVNQRDNQRSVDVAIHSKTANKYKSHAGNQNDQMQAEAID